MKEIFEDLTKKRDTLVKATFSSPREGAEFSRTVLRPVQLKSGARWQSERFAGTKVFHLNLTDEALGGWQDGEGSAYRQIALFSAGKTVTYLRRGAGWKRSEAGNALSAPAVRGNNREKEYLLKEGEAIPAFVDLGVFTADYRIKADKYDKYKQINRFLEIVDDALRGVNKKSFTLLDFGCGKSYLTFFLYHYLVKMRGMNAKIVGYDLKADVVAQCNEIAEKYGYDGLRFYVNDVTKGGLYEGEIDAVVTLHACDVATDYALAFAVERGAEYIFSVPCCQHEVNGSIRAGGDFDLLLRHGLFKERFSALLTDAVRAELLRATGYSVDVLEFVDFSHSPKNVMLRARRTRSVPLASRDFSRVEGIMEKYGFRQSLYRLLSGREGV